MSETYYERNRERLKEYSRQYWANNREASKAKCSRYNADNREDMRLKNRERFWKSRGIKITTEEYNRLFEQQEGCCLICGTHQSEEKKSLAVDHCHKTGRIRGLLCGTCNRGLGLFYDDPDLFRQAVRYLEGI